MQQVEVIAYMLDDSGQPYNVIVWVDSRQRLSRWKRQQLGPESEPLKPRLMSKYAQDMEANLLRKW